MTAGHLPFMFRFMFRFVRLILELIASLVGVLALLGLVLVWRLNASPVSSAFLTPYIETAVDQIAPETKTQIAQSMLTWDNVERTINLHVDDASIKNKRGDTIAEIPSMNIKLSILGILVGRFLPIELIVDHPQIKLERHDDGQLYFGGMAPGTSDDGNESALTAVRGLAQDVTHSYFLRKIEITRTVLDVTNSAGKHLWSVSVPDVSLGHVTAGIAGHIAVDLTQKDHFSTIEIHYLYNRAKKQHELTTSFDGIVPALLAGGQPASLGLKEASYINLPLTGQVAAVLDDNLVLSTGSLKLDGGKGELNVPDLWDKPRFVQSLAVEFDYNRAAQRLNIDTANIDFGGPQFDFGLQGTLANKPGDDLDFDLSVELKNWPMDQFTQLWPKPVVPNAREWMAANLLKGTYDHGQASFKGHLAWNDLDNVAITEGSGDVDASRGSVQYIKGMPLVEGVNARATFDLKQMDILISSGSLYNLKIVPFTAKITGLDLNDQFIDIPLKLNGPIPDVLRLIDNKPLEYAKAVGLTTDAITGKADGEVDLHFPLDKNLSVNNVDVKVTTSLSDVASSKIVKGVNITQGVLTLSLDKEGFSTKGPLMLNGVPFDSELHQIFAPKVSEPFRTVELKGTLKEEQWKTLGIAALDGTHGPSVLDVKLTETSKTQATAVGSLDMTGAEVHVAQLNWKKPQGTPAVLKFAADIPQGKDIKVKSLSLHGGGANVKGTALIAPTGTIKSVKLDPLVVGRTNAALSFGQSDEDDHVLRFEATGASLDVSGLQGGKDPGHTDTRRKEYALKVGKLYTSADGSIDNVDGQAIRDAQGWRLLALHGVIDGSHKLDLDLKEDGAGRAFSITCDNFGEALKGLGLTNSVREGDMKVVGHSLPDNPRVIEGTMRIGYFEVRKLPALMLLLNATSPFGFVDILHDSVSFDNMRGVFRWEGDAVDFKHIEAAGTSIGMNIAGHVDLDTGEAKLHGTLVPFSTVNGILESIPIIGDLITGGNGGGILAVAYDIKGPLSAPKVGVNPVSLLTPGFIRNIFFDSGESDAEKAEGSEAPAK